MLKLLITIILLKLLMIIVLRNCHELFIFTYKHK